MSEEEWCLEARLLHPHSISISFGSRNPAFQLFCHHPSSAPSPCLFICLILATHAMCRLKRLAACRLCWQREIRVSATHLIWILLSDLRLAESTEEWRLATGLQHQRKANSAMNLASASVIGQTLAALAGLLMKLALAYSGREMPPSRSSPRTSAPVAVLARLCGCGIKVDEAKEAIIKGHGSCPLSCRERLPCAMLPSV